MTRTFGLQSITRTTTVGGKTHRYCQKQESLSLHDFLSIGRHLLRVLFKKKKPTVKFIHSSNHPGKGEGQGKFILEQATKAQKGSRGIALLFL